MKSQSGILSVLCLALLFITVKSYGQQPAVPVPPTYNNEAYAMLVAEGASPKMISKQFSFTEGPAVDKKGNIFFTDQPNDKIWKYGIDGSLTVFLDKAGRSNGMYFDEKGNLITCADGNNELWSVNKKGKITVLVKDYQGKKLNGPNDVWIRPKNGGMYFTDPYFQRNYWTRTKTELDGQKVFYLPKGKTEPVPVVENLAQPNGIVGTPDGKLLYVADGRGRKTHQYTINDDGKLTDDKVLCESGSDGMTLDNQGNLYLTGRGVTVYNKDGKQIAHIDIPEKWTANVSFAGKDRNQLFITASEAIYVLDMKVKGVE